MFSADFDQIELRIAAACAREPVLIEAAKKGESLHKAAAIRLFGSNFTLEEYTYTKNVNFGWLFGGGAFTLSRQAGIPLKQAQEIITEYGKTFVALTKYKRTQQNMIIRQALNDREFKTYQELKSRMFDVRIDTSDGRTLRERYKTQINRLLFGKLGYVTTQFGRRLPVEAHKAYRVVNYEIQSSARDILGQALLDVMGDNELEPTVLLPIHDELLGQGPISKAEYLATRYGEVMSREFLGVPITASGKVYGKSWGHGYMSEEEQHASRTPHARRPVVSGTRIP